MNEVKQACTAMRPLTMIGYQNGEAYKLAEINWHLIPPRALEALDRAATFVGMITEDDETFALYSGVHF